MRAVLLLVVGVDALTTLAHAQLEAEMPTEVSAMLGVGVVIVPEAGGQVAHPPSSTGTLRRLQARTANACAGCSCVAEHIDVCSGTDTFDDLLPEHHQSACESLGGDGRCVFNQGMGPSCTSSNTTVTPETACTDESANGAAACAGAGSCVYNDGTADDVCEPADLATCATQSANGETACLSAGACTFIANEDHRITERTDGSEWNADLATKLALSSAQHPNGLPMGPSSVCSDAMASNNGVAGPCTFDCSYLEQAYFPRTAQTVRCFVYDLVNGWPADLLSRIETTKRYEPHNPASTMTVADNTIYIPRNESWIIQGVSAIGALPPVLPARLASGSRDEISRANLVLRSFRITSQTAPLDAKGLWYTFSNANIGADPGMRLGGAVSYEGHGSRLLFERMIIDHNVGTSGGGIFIYGHFQRNPNVLMTQIDMVDCLFWANQARWCGGDARLVDIWPLEWTVDGCHFFDSWAFLVKTVSLSEYANQMDAGKDGGPILGLSAAPTLTGPSHVVMRNCFQDGTNSNSYDALVPGWRGFVVDLTAWATEPWQRIAVGAAAPMLHVLHENVVTQNYEMEFYAGSAHHNYMQGADGMQFNITVVDCDWFDNVNHDAANVHTQGGITAHGDWLMVANSRVERGGFAHDGQSGGEGGAILVDGSQMATIRHSSFVSNWAALGGAVAISGANSAEFQSCTFIENIASRSGGAIEFKAAATMFVQDSTFLMNVVYTPDPEPQDKTVRLYTGSSGPENPGTHSGDEAMFTCEWFVVPACDPCLPVDMPSAINGSIDHMVGVISSPIDGDGVYHAYRTYSHQLALPPGDYRLYHGSKVNTQDLVAKWRGGGWIEMIGVIDRVYVKFDDNRASARQAGCYQGADAAPITDASCPLGQKFWSLTTFSIGFGNGGALSLAGTSGVTIQDTMFRNNVAGHGASAYGVSVTSLDLVGTTLDDVAQPLELYAVQLESCGTRPCSPGSMCSMFNSSRFCYDCGINEIGDGRVCTACPPGTGPNADHSVCTECPVGKSSALGLCGLCGPISYAPVTGQAVCLPCPDRMQANLNKTGCICTDGSLNASTKMSCYAVDYSPPPPASMQCLSCDALECIATCADGAVAIRPGWIKLDRDDNSASVFECRHKVACNNSQCAEGYGGPLCGVCEPGYHVNSRGLCEECGGHPWLGIILLCALMITFAVGFHIVDESLDRVVALKQILDVATDLQLQALARVTVATMQIITNFAPVLNISFPEVFATLLSYLKLCNFNFAEILSIGCLTSDSYFTSLAVSCCVVVFVVSAVCANYFYHHTQATNEGELRELFVSFDPDGDGITEDEIVDLIGTLKKVDVSKDQIKDMFKAADTDGSGRLEFEEFCAAFDEHTGIGEIARVMREVKVQNNCLGQLFLLIFLLYPSITNQIFEIFMCRELGPNTSPSSILHTDYSVDCAETQYFRWSLGTIFVIIWPLGLPVLLFAMVYRRRVALRASDEDTSAMFNFLIVDYQPDYYYWECVELGRKLLLTGVVTLLGRGTIAQAIVATLISFSFFATHMHVQPYKSRTINVVKAISEIQLFVVLLVTVVLQVHHVGFASEPIQEYGYGIIQTIATVAIVPVIIVFVIYNTKMFIADVKGNDTDTSKPAVADFGSNPLNEELEEPSGDFPSGDPPFVSEDDVAKEPE